MPENNKDTEAKQLIDELTDKLISLNNGTPIPAPWVINLRKAILRASEPSSNKRGPKFDIEKVALVTELIILNWDNLFKERTKHHKPGKLKNAIAVSSGFSRRQIDRYIKQYKEMLNGNSPIDPNLEYAFMWGAAVAAAIEGQNEEPLNTE